MRSELRQNIALIVVFMILAALSAWLQFGLLNTPVSQLPAPQDTAEDYYIENFVAIGMDAFGKKYQLAADRLVHFPADNKALLDNPHIVQYDIEQPPRHIYADSGWFYNATSKILLRGNVRVIQGKTESAGNTSTSEKMVIMLDQDRG